MSYSKTALFALAVTLLFSAEATFSQRNNPFSANPASRTTVASVRSAGPRETGIQQPSTTHPEPSIDATRLYKVGGGDTLFIVLVNAPNASGYYSVRADGTIDFPLAGDRPSVQGLTTGEIELMLASRVRLYRNAQLHVAVREFGSHKITVSGLVERNGERFLQREAMPLFTVKADVGVTPAARTVVITRASGGSATFRLEDLRTDDVLVSAGDKVEFYN